MIWYIKIWDRNKLVRNLIPVAEGDKIYDYIAPANGMFDLVTETFFGNQNKSSFNGKPVSIKVFNAINLENFDWSLADKDEVVAALTYTGTYEEDSPEDFEPWEVEFAD